MDAIEFEISGLPKTINNIGQRSWKAKWAEARKWKNLVYEMCVYHRIKDIKLQKAKLTLTRYSSKEPDFDGLVSSFKNSIDGLIMAGVIVNDKMSNIGAPEYKWEPTKQKAGKIRIKIEKQD